MADDDKQSDESLMVRVISGDHPAFATLVRRHTQRFYASVCRMGIDQIEAEDIVQDAFLKLWRRPQSWNPDKGAKFTTWFYRIVMNTATDYLRKKKPATGSDVLDSIADERGGAEHDMEDKEQQEALECAIQSLPDRQKTALNLCFYDGFSNKEAAEILGIGVKAVESLIMRAKAGVREYLTTGGFVDEREKKDAKYG